MSVSRDAATARDPGADLLAVADEFRIGRRPPCRRDGGVDGQSRDHER